MDDALVDVIILNYRNVDLTLTCLASVDALDYPDVRVVVVDNGSGDGSADRLWAVLRQRSGAIRHAPSVNAHGLGEAISGDITGAPAVLVESPTNHGYGAGVNAGLRFVMEHDRPTYIWVLNNDVVVARDSLSRLVERATRDPHLGLLGCDERRAFDDGTLSDEVLSQGGFLTNDRWTGQFWSNLETVPAGSRRHHSIEANLIAPNGAAVFVSTAFLATTGLFPEYTFLSYEEIDLGLRARRAGFEVGYSPDAHIWHRHSATSPRNEYLLSRARMLVARRYRPWTLPVGLAYALARAGRMSVSAGLRKDVWPSLLGTLDGLWGKADRYPDLTPLSEQIPPSA